MRGVMFFMAWVLVLTASGAGCPGPSAEDGSARSGEASVDFADLAAQGWELAAIGEASLAEDAARPTLGIEEGRLTGSTGCNRWFADLSSLGPGRLELSELGATKRGCPGPIMQVEATFLQNLRKVRRYEIRDRVLLLFGEGEAAPLLRFRPSQAE